MTGLLALLDDIALLSDDVATGAKTATVKTSGILGDDVAVNAEKATGSPQKRELIVIYEIFKGSMKNKTILLPIVFLLSWLYPPLLILLLILGGLYLLFEGGEKIHHILFQKIDDEKHIEELKGATSENVLDLEKNKIKSAIFTDFVLSLEIIVIAFNSIPNYSFIEQIIIVTLVAYAVTILVYGLVASIVRIDNTGFWLMEKGLNYCGMKLVAFQDFLLKSLTYIGTVAMFVVGGDIINHQYHIVSDNIVSVIAMGILMGIVIAFLVDIIKIKFLKT
jgi:predicted DNA repair protein MutK